MVVYIILFLYLIGFIIYFFKRNTILYYYLLWSFFSKYIASFVIFDMEMLRTISGQANFFLALIFFVESIRKENLIINSKSVILVVWILALLLLGATLHAIPYYDYINWFISNIIPIYFLAFILKNIKLSITTLNHFCLAVLIVELVMGYCQYYTSILFVSPYYALDYQLSGVEINRFLGSFNNNNIMAACICLLYFITIVTTTFNSFIKKVGFIVLTTVVIYGILLSGIRTYLVLMMIYFPILLYVKFNNKSLALGSSAAIILVAFTYLIANSYVSDKKGDNPIDRQINGMSALKAGDMNATTLYCSTYVIDNFYNPLHIFGEGKLYTPRGYDIITHRKYGKPQVDVTDATLAVYIVEFGTILFFLIIYYYYYMTLQVNSPNSKKINKNIKKAYWMIFSFFLISSITDSGIFNMDVLTLLSMMVIGLKLSQNKLANTSNQKTQNVYLV